jgi:hypothetical protein
MIRSFLFKTFLLLLSVGPLAAQQLTFRKDGKFRIVQFTDIHYVAGLEPSKKSISMMEATLDAEKPDLVVFTGDVVVNAPTKKGWDEVLQVVISRRIPYLVTFGNHDDEKEMRRHEVAEYISTKPYLLNNRVSEEGVSGFLNASLTVQSKDGKPGAILYAMDSHAYSKNSRVKGYGWFAHDQVNWFRKTSAAHLQASVDTLPALAFFHIPLPEYRLAFNDIKNKRVGVRYENECPPEINTGMYAAMFEAGDVLGTFVGHDHVNDYLVDYNGIALTYGCWSGSSNTYQRSKNGARIIELTEGKRQFSTYIREFDGQKIYPVDYPFPQKKK